MNSLKTYSSIKLSFLIASYLIAIPGAQAEPTGMLREIITPAATQMANILRVLHRCQGRY